MSEKYGNHKCEACGETDPYPRWFCMLKATGNAVKGQPCGYSLEASERMKAKFAAPPVHANQGAGR